MSKNDIKNYKETEAAYQNLLQRLEGTNILDLTEAIKALEKKRDEIEKRIQPLKDETRALDLRILEQEKEYNLAVRKTEDTRRQTEYARKELEGYTDIIESGITPYHHPAEPSVTLEAELKKTRKGIKDAIKNKTAITTSSNFTLNGSSKDGDKFLANLSKIMLRAYNAEAENCVLTVKAGNGETARKRLERTRDQVEKLAEIIDLHISPKYHNLRLKELQLALDYQNAKQAEKEAEREEKARLREEAKAMKELAAEREKLVKERAHYENVILELMKQGNAEAVQQFQEKLDEINAQIDTVDFREANQRAGYVYVISNIGSFGKRMVKIGMTRRLDPMERVRELSDASVPFNFDVHALFFTEDAVGVETELHHRFAKQRVNLVNPRREFFAVTPLEVKEALVEVAGNLLEFVEEPEAAQYRESESMRETL
ncbi:DUF4041 domain-containing protein [Mobiluncus porci]|uniref:DUF4041 domain-containing protein n=1 Tax=Mobiluncus porci TaxID=2652278 RepID=UPI0030B8B147